MDVARVVLPAPPGPSMATIMGPSAGLAEAFRRAISTDDALGQRDLVLTYALTPSIIAGGRNAPAPQGRKAS